MSGAATALREVTKNGASADIHISVEPKMPEQGTIFNANGQQVATKKGMVVKVDEKLSEQITVRKSTLWMIGVVPAILMVLFNYGSSALGWARDDTTKALQIQELQNQVKEIKESQKIGFAAMGEDVKDIKKTMQSWEIKKSFELGTQQGR